MASPTSARTVLSVIPVGAGVAILAIAAAVIGFAALHWERSGTAPVAGFWYEDGRFTLPNDAIDKLNGPLHGPEIEAIKQASRTELQRAFSGLRIAFTQSRDAFWRVAVLQTLQRRGPLPNAGESFVLGPLGGRGSVSFLSLALNAIQHAPPGAPRSSMIDAIGRGIGRAAAHECAHQILGSSMRDNVTDENSYEYRSADRASQYYGELHWTTAWPLLREKIGN